MKENSTVGLSEMKNRACSKILIQFYTLIKANDNVCSNFGRYLEVLGTGLLGAAAAACAGEWGGVIRVGGGGATP